MVKRILMVLTAALLMAAITAVPAFAGVQGGTHYGGPGQGGGYGDSSDLHSSGHDLGQTGGIFQGNPHLCGGLGIYYYPCKK